jgi:LPPG:FO 2-phospho-L-lactate transferase
LTIIVNTGDDMKWWGLYVSPDIDSVMYMLAGKLSRERGWGVSRDTFFCLQAMEELEQQAWFQTGDRDLATHIFRTQLLAEEKTLSEATAEIAQRLGVRARILPMSDARVETRVLTASGEVSFQEYFVRRRYQDRVEAVRFAGASEAAPAPGVIDAIRSAEFILVAPSNPITSIGPILAVPGIREALRERRDRTVAISPIVGQAAVSGPAGALLAAHGFAVSIGGVADCYRDFIGHLLVDSQDAVAAEHLHTDQLQIHCAPTIMRTDADRVALAKSVMAACHESSFLRVSEPA